MKSFIQKYGEVLLVIAAGGFVRFFNPLWDNGLFLHPDERLFVNASNLSLPKSFADFFSISSPLNPHMFYYGSLLLYLYKLASLVSPLSLLATSRLFSAFFSTLTIGIIFLIGKELFSKKVGLISSITFALAAGSIQYAHFNTTESSLIFLITLITLVDVVAVKKKKPMFLILSLLLVGISGAIKITGLIFGISPLLASALFIKERAKWKKTIFAFLAGSCVAAMTYVLFSPYQFIDWQESVQQQSYMQAVTYGVFKPPFVMIYQHTIPYIYQLLQVFPFVFGFISFPLALVGLFLLVQKIAKEWRTELLSFFLLAFPLMYFAWSGAWFAKYARYYILLLPFLALWAGYFIAKMQRLLQIAILLFILFNGILFARLYISANTRVAASEWIYHNIPAQSTIATEHWDDALPLSFGKNQQTEYDMRTLFVYDPETQTKIEKLAATIASSDYIILSSRRVYESILANSNLYPTTSLFYQKLFSNDLGFVKIYEKTNYPFLFSDDSADETFQSYDHPPVVIFANSQHFSKEKILSELESPSLSTKKRVQ